MVCYCFAMEQEAAPLLENAKILEEKKSGFARLLLIEKFGRAFLVVVSGIGKGFAASGLTSAILLYHPERIINFGVAGSLDARVAPILSAVISSSLVEHDLDTSVIGDPKGLVSGINIVHLPADETLRKSLAKACDALKVTHEEGVISSGDTFMEAHDPRKNEFRKEFGTLVVDMESAPFAQIAYAFGIPFCSVRTISDSEHPETEYAANVKACSKLACAIAEEYLKEEEK